MKRIYSDIPIEAHGAFMALFNKRFSFVKNEEEFVLHNLWKGRYSDRSTVSLMIALQMADDLFAES